MESVCVLRGQGQERYASGAHTSFFFLLKRAEFMTLASDLHHFWTHWDTKDVFWFLKIGIFLSSRLQPTC